MSSVNDMDIVEPLNYWANRWKEQTAVWHIDKINSTLVQYIDRLTLNSIPKKFMIPLCGKTYDIAYLSNLGHHVFAVEGVPEVIQELNDRDSLGLRFNEADSTYTSIDNKIVIFVGDLMHCPIEKWGPVDCIWDRASLIAVDYSQREAYVDVIKRSVQMSKGTYNDFRYLLETVCYEKSSFPGPPRSVDEGDMAQHYSDWCEIELLSKQKEEVFSPLIQKALGEGCTVDRLVYLLKPK